MEDDEEGERRNKKPRTESAGLSASADDASSDLKETPDASSRERRSVRVDPAPGLDILNRILSGNASLSTHLSGLETPAGMKAKEIVSSQAEPIAELRGMFLDATSKGTLVDVHAVFSKASALVRGTQDGFFPLLRGLPSDVSELVLKQDEMISGLRHSYFAAAGGATSTETPEVSSSGAPRDPAVGHGAPANNNDTPDSSISTMCSGVYVSDQ